MQSSLPFLQNAPLQDSDLVSFAESLADLARPMAMKYFRGALETVVKGDGSPVTVADRGIEQAMRARIAAYFPEHGIFGEEFGVDLKPMTWVLDPIDGTKSFITGMPLFGTLIALVDGGEAVLGIIDMPALNERWIGTAAGTIANGEAVRTSQCERLSDAVIYTTSPDAFTSSGWRSFEEVSRRARLRRFGGDCYGYALLASGYADLVVEEGLHPYDYMALVAVVEGAGGVITDWSGDKLGLSSDGRVIAAATRSLHAEALTLLKGKTLP